MLVERMDRIRKIVLIGLSMFVISVNSRPPGHVKAFSEFVCARGGRGIYQADSVRWCCNCPEGYFKSKDCRHGEPNTIVCEQCIFDSNDPTKQTYIDVENNRTDCFTSISELDCLKKMNTRFVRGSYKRRSRCECEDGHYSTSETLKYGCNKHSSCDPGYYAIEIGTNTTDTRCMNCPDGTFSNESSPMGTCKNFTKCQPNEVEISGSSSSDVVCVDTSASTTLPPETTTAFGYTEPVVEEKYFVWTVILEAMAAASAIVLVCFGICWVRNKCRSSNGPCRGLCQDQRERQRGFSGNTTYFLGEKNELNCVEMKAIASATDDESKAGIDERDGAYSCDSRTDTIESSDKSYGKCPINLQNEEGNERSVVAEIINSMNLHGLNFKRIEIRVKYVLHDEKLVPEMLKSLIEYTTNGLLRSSGRTFPMDTERKDIEININTELPEDTPEIKYQSLIGRADKRGCRLTPLNLLVNFDNNLSRCFRDVMLRLILEHLENLMENEQDKEAETTCLV